MAHLTVSALAGRDGGRWHGPLPAMTASPARQQTDRVNGCTSSPLTRRAA